MLIYYLFLITCSSDLLITYNRGFMKQEGTRQKYLPVQDKN